MRLQLNQVLNQLAHDHQAKTWADLDEPTRQKLSSEVLLFDPDQGKYTTVPAKWFGRMVEGAEPAANKLSQEDEGEIARLNLLLEQAGFKKRLPTRKVQIQVTVKELEERAKELEQWVERNKDPVRVEALCEELEMLCTSPELLTETVTDAAVAEALSSAINDTEAFTAETVKVSKESLAKSKLCDLAGICYQSTGSANGVLKYLKNRLEQLNQEGEANQSLIAQLKGDIIALDGLNLATAWLPANGSPETVSYVAEIMLSVRGMDLEGEDAETALLHYFEQLCLAYPADRESLLKAEELMVKSLPFGHRLRSVVSQRALNQLLKMREAHEPEHLKLELASTARVDEMARMEGLGRWRDMPSKSQYSFISKNLAIVDGQLKPEASNWLFQGDDTLNAGKLLNEERHETTDSLNRFVKAAGSQAYLSVKGVRSAYTVRQLEELQQEVNEWVSQNKPLMEAYQVQQRVLGLACREQADDESRLLIEKALDAELEHLIELTHEHFELNSTLFQNLIEELGKLKADFEPESTAHKTAAHFLEKASFLNETCKTFPAEYLRKPVKVDTKSLGPLLKAVGQLHQPDLKDLDQDYFAALSQLCAAGLPLNNALEVLDTCSLNLSDDRCRRMEMLSESVRLVVFGGKLGSFDEIQRSAEKLLAKVDALRALGAVEPADAADIRSGIIAFLDECERVELNSAVAMGYLAQVTASISEPLLTSVAEVGELCDDLLIATGTREKITTGVLGQIVEIFDQLKGQAARATPEESKAFDALYETLIAKCEQVGIPHGKASKLALTHTKSAEAKGYLTQLDEVHQLVPMVALPPKGLVVMLHNAGHALENLKAAGADHTKQEAACEALRHFIAVSIERPDLIDLQGMLHNLKAWIHGQESEGKLFQAELEDGLFGKRKPANAYSVVLSNIVAEAAKNERKFSGAIKKSAQEDAYSDFSVSRWVKRKSLNLPDVWRDAFVCRAVLSEHREFVSLPKRVPWEKRVYRSEAEPEAHIYSSVIDLKTGVEISSASELVPKTSVPTSSVAIQTEPVLQGMETMGAAVAPPPMMAPPPPPPPAVAPPPPPPPPLPSSNNGAGAGKIVKKTAVASQPKKADDTPKQAGFNPSDIKSVKLRRVGPRGDGISKIAALGDKPVTEGAVGDASVAVSKTKKVISAEELEKRRVESLQRSAERKKKELETELNEAKINLTNAVVEGKGQGVVDALQFKINTVEKRVKEFNSEHPEMKIGTSGIIKGAEKPDMSTMAEALNKAITKKRSAHESSDTEDSDQEDGSESESDWD